MLGFKFSPTLPSPGQGQQREGCPLGTNFKVAQGSEEIVWLALASLSGSAHSVPKSSPHPIAVRNIAKSRAPKRRCSRVVFPCGVRFIRTLQLSSSTQIATVDSPVVGFLQASAAKHTSRHDAVSISSRDGVGIHIGRVSTIVYSLDVKGCLEFLTGV